MQFDPSRVDLEYFRHFNETRPEDRAAVDAELERLSRLAALGGFIPCPDHRLMPGSKFELVKYYAEEIKRLKI